MTLAELAREVRSGASWYTTYSGDWYKDGWRKSSSDYEFKVHCEERMTPPPVGSGCYACREAFEPGKKRAVRLSLQDRENGRGLVLLHPRCYRLLFEFSAKPLSKIISIRQPCSQEGCWNKALVRFNSQTNYPSKGLCSQHFDDPRRQGRDGNGSTSERIQNVLKVAERFELSNYEHFSCIYIALQGDKIHYVGQSENLRGRITGHAWISQLRDETLQLFYIPVRPQDRRLLEMLVFNYLGAVKNFLYESIQSSPDATRVTYNDQTALKKIYTLSQRQRKTARKAARKVAPVQGTLFD